ncbi:MAG: hypothetical protein WC523_03940 [Patescibacteria group bacterium]
MDQFVWNLYHDLLVRRFKYEWHGNTLICIVGGMRYHSVYNWNRMLKYFVKPKDRKED